MPSSQRCRGGVMRPGHSAWHVFTQRLAMKELPNPTFALSPVHLPRGSLHPSGAPELVASPAKSGIEVRWARHADEVREAQRLRHAVFAGEMGARLAVPPGTPEGLDVDRFDAHCEHLLVRATEPDGAPGRVVGTYRVLTPAGARLAGGL